MRPIARVLTILLLLSLLTSTAGAVLAADDAKPDDAYAHPEWFADVPWLTAHLDDEDLALIALTPPEEFVAGHIPGAAQIDWKAFEVVETSDASVASWRADVERILTELGVKRDDTVVVYDGGTFVAARVWWLLHHLGHADVRVLNGGLPAWVAEGGELEQGERPAEPAATPYQGTPNEATLITIDEAVAAFEEREALFVDARRPDDEYAVGHIPGAVNVPFMANAEAEGPKYLKPAAELRAMYEAAGITEDRAVIAYCASGVRSAVTYFTLLQLGYEDVAVFTGSFAEWSSDPARPVTEGTAP